MPDSPERLAGRMAAEGEKTFAYLHSVGPEAWERTVYTEGTCWTVQQILAHFVATEAAFIQLFEDVLSGGAGAPENFDLNRFNEKQVAKLREAGVEELLEAFRRRREDSVALVRRMTPADLARTGRHPWLGITSLEDMIKLLYRHNGIHLRDVRKALASGEGEAEEIAG